MKSDDQAPQSGGSDELRELEAYRDKVLELLKERERRMQEIEKELSRVLFSLKEYGVQKMARSGDVRAIVRGESLRTGLAKERDKLMHRLEESKSEVALARERLQMAEEDLSGAREDRGGTQ